MNARSVCPTFKSTEIYDYIIEKDADVFVITETWLTETEKNRPVIASLVPPGYSIQHVPRPRRSGGGGYAIFKTGLDIQKEQLTVPPNYSLGLIHLSLVHSSATYRQHVVYRPPPCKKNNFTCNHLLTMLCY